jgi:hypothetical protein
VVLFDINNYYTTIPSKRKDELIPYILNDLNTNSNVQCYWETREDYKNNTFRIISNSLITVVEVTVNGVKTGYAPTIINRVTETINGIELESKNRLYKHDIIYDVQDFSFAKTTERSPVCTINEGKLFVQTNDSFAVSSALLTYIRKPRLLNFELGITPDINNHRDILIKAVNKVNAVTTNQKELELGLNVNKFINT